LLSSGFLGILQLLLEVVGAFAIQQRLQIHGPAPHARHLVKVLPRRP
jgi:hypothetical protein